MDIFQLVISFSLSPISRTYVFLRFWYTNRKNGSIRKKNSFVVFHHIKVKSRIHCTIRNMWDVDADSLPRKLWGRPGIVWCLPSCPRLNKRFRWGVALCGLSRSKGWPAQRHSAIAWLPREPGGENENSLDALASPCLLIFDDLSFRALSNYRPKRGHESVVASKHGTSGLVSNISHPPLLPRIDERISPRVLALNLPAREIALWLIRNTLTIGRKAFRCTHESHCTTSESTSRQSNLSCFHLRLNVLFC